MVDSTMPATEARALVTEVERLLEETEAIADASARETALGAVAALLELYGAGLEHIVATVAEHDEAGSLAEALADDELVAHLLLLHGLHPVGLTDRVQGALAQVRPYLESHGGDVELLEVREADAEVHLRLKGSCRGCPSSAMTLKLAIEQAIHQAAPEIEHVIADAAAGAGAGAPSGQSPLLQIELAPAALPMAAEPEWEMAGGLPELARCGRVVREVSGHPILFLRLLDGTTLAYHPECPQCGSSLADAPVAATELTCPGCTSRFDVLRAGRGLDSPHLHLEPIPLLVGEDDLVKIALPMGV